MSALHTQVGHTQGRKPLRRGALCRVRQSSGYCVAQTIVIAPLSCEGGNKCIEVCSSLCDDGAHGATMRGYKSALLEARTRKRSWLATMPVTRSSRTTSTRLIR